MDMNKAHQAIWAAIDEIAVEQGLTPSALARKSGLDPTSFNPSKRFGPDGRPRWPGTEILLRMLEACNLPFHRFAELVEARMQPPRADRSRPDLHSPS